mmetsp:Transcript_49843/g.160194  ORF Transcript_49843/g.160194 Transcript_49843/m.160194 type:complete len:277 (+) Transcript_49843:118-948(+)
MMRFAQQPSTCTNAALVASMGKQTEPQEDGVRVFGPPAKSNAEIIAEMLAKLPAPQVCTSAHAPPLAFACATESESHWATPMHCQRPPPGLKLPAHLIGCGFVATQLPFKKCDDELSTTDGSSSEHSFMLGDSCLATDVNTTQDKTTLMVRNLPSRYTEKMLLEEWKCAGNFDFLYLPCTTGGQTNRNYAFINFASEAEAVAFQAGWHKKRLAQFNWRNALNISFAEVQGLQANLTQLRKKRTRCSDPKQCQPLVLVGDQYLSLPDALQYLSFSVQ